MEDDKANSCPKDKAESGFQPRGALTHQADPLFKMWVHSSSGLTPFELLPRCANRQRDQTDPIQYDNKQT